MRKDERYEMVRYKIAKGEIKEFGQMFKYIPKTVMAADLGSSTRHLKRISDFLEEIPLGDIYDISKLVGVEMDVIYELVKQQFLVQKGDISTTRKVSQH